MYVHNIELIDYFSQALDRKLCLKAYLNRGK